MVTKMNNTAINKFIYIRDVSVLANDDADSDSIVFPVSSFRGAARLAATIFIIYWEKPYQYADIDAGNCDNAQVVISSETHVALFETIANEIATGENAFIVIGDNVTSDYITGVSSVFSISSDVTDD